MIIDKDIIITVFLFLIPWAVGVSKISGWIIDTYWNWLWKGIKKQCYFCDNVKEVRINDSNRNES